MNRNPERDIPTARISRSSANLDAFMKWGAGILAVLLSGAVIGAHSTLWTHEVRITKTESQLDAASQRLGGVDRKLEIIDQKLDRLLERR